MSLAGSLRIWSRSFRVDVAQISAPNCRAAVPGSDPTPLQPKSKSANFCVSCYIGWHRTLGWPLKGASATKIR